MLFQFLKYLQPTNYFLLKRNNNAFIFPDSTQLPKDVLDNLVPDNNYKTEQATAYDLSWQAIQKGYSGDTQTISETNINLVYDEYVFSRKYFNADGDNPIVAISTSIKKGLAFKYEIALAVATKVRA